VHRDAAVALSQLITLDDIKLRLLKAPDGLKALVFMTRSPNLSVKRAAAKALINLSSLEVAQEAIVRAGGLRFLFALTSIRCFLILYVDNVHLDLPLPLCDMQR
jgi:hypothetical protein